MKAGGRSPVNLRAILGLGLPPKFIRLAMGKTVKRDVNKGTPLSCGALGPDAENPIKGEKNGCRTPGAIALTWHEIFRSNATVVNLSGIIVSIRFSIRMHCGRNRFPTYFRLLGERLKRGSWQTIIRDRRCTTDDVRLPEKSGLDAEVVMPA